MSAIIGRLTHWIAAHQRMIRHARRHARRFPFQSVWRGVRERISTRHIALMSARLRALGGSHHDRNHDR